MHGSSHTPLLSTPTHHSEAIASWRVPVGDIPRDSPIMAHLYHTLQRAMSIVTVTMSLYVTCSENTALEAYGQN